MADRENLLAYAREKYGTSPESLWPRQPRYVVLRHAENGKWYAVLMNVRARCLHLPGTGEVDVVNVKSPFAPDMLLSGVEGVFPAYHMNKRRWISLALDGSFPEEELYRLVDESYLLTR